MASAAGAISAEWKGAETGSISARLAPFSVQSRAASSTAAFAPEITSCPPPLSLAIWQTEPLAASAQAASTSACSSPMIAAMAPSPDRHRRLHGVAADAQQPRRVGDREHAGRGKRRIFAERMAGDIGNLVLQRKAARFQRPDRRHRHRHQRRLRVGGQRQRLFRPFPDQLRQLLAERVVDLVEHAPRLGKRVGQILAHADGLAALPRKGECDGHDCGPRLVRCDCL